MENYNIFIYSLNYATLMVSARQLASYMNRHDVRKSLRNLWKLRNKWTFSYFGSVSLVIKDYNIKSS
jgi:hypothetical protein